MKKFSGKSLKALSIAVFVIAVLLVLIYGAGKRPEDFTGKYRGVDLSGSSAGRNNTYVRYEARYADIPPGRRDIPVDIFSWDHADGVSIQTNFQGEDKVLVTDEKSSVEYTVRLEEAGLYNLYFEYFPVESRGINAERILKINGETPFLGAERLIFQRIWGDSSSEVRFDNQGNQIRPAQVEKPRWQSTWFTDALGYTTAPYKFYFKKGDNTIRFEGVNEPLALRAITLKAPVPDRTYREYIAGVDLPWFQNTDTGFMLKIQGEDALYRSDPSLYAVYDRSSGATDPASVAKIRLNMIGGDSWRVAGQWIEWEFEVPEDGMYRISVKGRQNYAQTASNRSVMIDGLTPCRELSAIPFKYNNKWQYTTLQAADGGDMFFPLTAGSHSLRLQVSLGELGDMLNTMEESVYRLNGMYRKILILTGQDPDYYRDYRVDYYYPDIIKAMDLESRILYKLVDDLTAYSGGQRSAEAAGILMLARQLELFVQRPDKIPRALGDFKSKISSLGDSLFSLSQSSLDIDYIVISAADARLPPIKQNFFVAASHELRSFVASFFNDYDSLGNVYGKKQDAITVWMLAGRDQSTILKGMIDDTFTPGTNIPVNVKLVSSAALLPSIVAGIGPDVVISTASGDPVNYAIRKAAVDLSHFDGFDEVTKQFDPCVLVPFRFQGGVYGLPETETFQIMFYRKDIFQELGLAIPDTWEDLINILPVIQKNNMDVGIPCAGGTDLSNFMTQLFQRGGALYTEDGSRTALNSEAAIEAFDAYTKFFTLYRVPMQYDFPSRFRTGEIPIGFADYSTFNVLQVFAPEIRGLWGYSVMPGLRKDDGTIDRSVPAGTTAAMIFSKSKKQESAWKFLTWWVSADTQLRFGREIESLLGGSARYPTANYDAFVRLPWSADQMAVLKEQRSWAVGVPEVPGGYFLNRHISNAIRRVINNNDDPRETLLDYSITINEELINKRQEFGLE